MALVPVVNPINVLEQGGRVFLNVPKWVDAKVLAAGTAKTYDVAAMRTAAGLNANQPFFLIFGSDAPFYVNYNGTVATVPAADTSDGSASQYTPNQLYIDSTITSISLISSVVAHITLAVYKS